MGRDNAVHALMAQGKMASTFLQDARRLAGVLDVALDGPGPYVDGPASAEDE